MDISRTFAYRGPQSYLGGVHDSTSTTQPKLSNVGTKLCDSVLFQRHLLGPVQQDRTWKSHVQPWQPGHRAQSNIVGDCALQNLQFKYSQAHPLFPVSAYPRDGTKDTLADTCSQLA